MQILKPLPALLSIGAAYAVSLEMVSRLRTHTRN